MSDDRARQATSADLAEYHKRDARHWQAQFEAAHWERAEIRQELQAARARIAALEEGLRLTTALVRAAQEILSGYLADHSNRSGLERDTLNALLGVFDGPQQRESRRAVIALLTPADPVEAPSDCHPQGE